MGSHLLVGMPRTGRYARVVALLGDSAGGGGAAGVGPGTLAQVADATLDAALAGLALARVDAGLAYCVYLLARTARAAREPDLLLALADAGLPTPAAISGLPDIPVLTRAVDLTSFDVTCGYTAAVDRRLRHTGGRTDVSELAQLGAAESLSVLARGGELGDAGGQTAMFGLTVEPAVPDALRAASTPAGFGRLASDFFARFVRRFLEYHLSRELSNHVGPGRRFAHADAHDAFLRELGDHCQACASVVRPFAGQWYAKRDRLGDLTEPRAQGLAARALGLVRAAVAHQEGRDAGDQDL
ncbi:MAG TPA: hypothetical protein VF796_01590 [Humisphaera sp.]